MSTLRVYVDSACPACARARQLAATLAHRYPRLRVDVVNVADEGIRLPEKVFAVPTFLLDGHVLSLGTPNSATLIADLDVRLADETRASNP